MKKKDQSGDVDKHLHSGLYKLSILLLDGERERHALLHRKAGIRMGLCAPAVVAANAALEGSTAACGITGLEGVEAFFFFGKIFQTRAIPRAAHSYPE